MAAPAICPPALAAAIINCPPPPEIACAAGRDQPQQRRQREDGQHQQDAALDGADRVLAVAEHRERGGVDDRGNQLVEGPGQQPAVIRRNASAPSLVTAIAAATGQTTHSSTTTGPRTSISANCSSEASPARPYSTIASTDPSGPAALAPARTARSMCSPTPSPSKPVIEDVVGPLVKGAQQHRHDQRAGAGDHDR